MGASIKFILGVVVVAIIFIFIFLFAMSRVIVGNKPLIYETNDYMVPRFRSSTWWQYQDFDRRKNWNVVILGSSHAYRGYDPEVFKFRGYDAFNLGTSMQTPANSYCLAKYYLDSVHTPLVIFDLYDELFTKNGLESDMDLIQNLDNTGLVINIALSAGDLRTLNMLALRFSQPREIPPNKPLHYDGYGFTPDPDTVLLHRGKKADPKVMLSSQQQNFESLVTLCSKRKIKLVLCSHQKRTLMNTLFHDRFHAYIDSIISDTGIPYIDYYNTTLLNDTEHFSQGSHLNSAGARIFTDHLVDTLESLGYLRSTK